MKSVIMLLFLTACAFAQGQQGSSPFSVLPEQPTIGSTISVTYRSDAPGAQLAGADAIELFTLVFRPGEYEMFLDTPMKKEGSKWVASFPLTNKNSCYLVFRCVSAGKADEGGDLGVDALIYGEDGKPVLGAHGARAFFMSRGQINSFKRTRDPAGATEEFNRERELYPQNWHAVNDYLGMISRQDQSDKGTPKLAPEVEKFAEMFKDNDEATSAITGWFNAIGDSARAQATGKAALAKNPDGVFARQTRWSHILETGELITRAGLIHEFLADHPQLDKKEVRSKMLTMFADYTKVKEYDRAADVLSKIENPSWQWYNELAWGPIEKGENLEKATAWARTGVELSRHPDPDEKRFYSTLTEWENNCRYSTGEILDTYAYGLFQLAKYDEAEKASAESFDLTKGDDADIVQRYLDCMIMDKHYEKAVEVGMESVKRGKKNDKILASLKRAYAVKEGQSGGFDKLSAEKQKEFDQLLTSASQTRNDQVRKDVAASRVSKPSVDFTLNNLEGKPVAFSSLKGKVVVIDFWATWCGPCKASFPYLQKVYDKYKDNQKVAFLVVDTWERVKGLPATVENAKKFVTDNKYTFPILIDEISGKKLAEKYQVTGIPTKFIIDKKGNVAFVSVGFNGPEMEQELTAQIELLLGESM